MVRVAWVVLVIAACTPAPVTSTRRVAYPDGKPHYEYELRDGIPHGPGRSWHANGERHAEGVWVNGVKHGDFTVFDERGAFAYNAHFFKGLEVWRSTDRAATPPPELLARLTASTDTPPQRGENFDPARPREPAISFEPPAPYFASMDRTTSISRIGMQVGVGDTTDLDLGAVRRYELFANYKLSELGVYGQVSQTTLTTEDTTLPGRRTLELGATYQVASVSLRSGLLVGVGNETSDGYIASSAGAQQRPADAIASFPSSVALRTGGSFTRVSKPIVIQVDAGIDWILGGPAAVDGLLRANGAIGVGVRSFLIGIELTNTIRVSDSDRRVHAAGLGGTFWMKHAWLNVLLSRSLDGSTVITGAVGYEL